MFPLYDTVRSRRFPLVNWLLIIANGLVFFYELQLHGPAIDQFINTWGLIPARLMHDLYTAWVTVITSMFLHGGWFHILSNMWFLFIFGDNIEDRMGGLRYLIFYLLSGTAAALLQTFLLADSQGPMIGASGAIAGVLGGYIVLFPRAKIKTLVFIWYFIRIADISAGWVLSFWFVLQLFNGLSVLNPRYAQGGVAFFAHIGGFIAGVILIRVFGIGSGGTRDWQIPPIDTTIPPIDQPRNTGRWWD